MVAINLILTSSIFTQFFLFVSGESWNKENCDKWSLYWTKNWTKALTNQDLSWFCRKMVSILSLHESNQLNWVVESKEEATRIVPKTNSSLNGALTTHTPEIKASFVVALLPTPNAFGEHSVHYNTFQFCLFIFYDPSQCCLLKYSKIYGTLHPSTESRKVIAGKAHDKEICFH